jgi:hypothetical protein
MTTDKNKDKKSVEKVYDEDEKRRKKQKRKIKDAEEETVFYEQLDDLDDELYSLLKKIK